MTVLSIIPALSALRSPLCALRPPPCYAPYALYALYAFTPLRLYTFTPSFYMKFKPLNAEPINPLFRKIFFN